MSKKLFKKVACFGDIHYGLKNNSRQHNDDCEAFVIWFIEQAKKRGCETCIFLGDWHHHRASVNVSTLNYTVSNLQRLNDAFETVYFITGNHDLFYREKREINSIPVINEMKNIVLVDEPLVKDDVAIIPWLVEDEYKKTIAIKSKYMFGHFEIPGFKLNAMIEMPDHGGLNKTMFKNQDYVFSGHFHKRQWSGNVQYIGNPFGHNFADAWDFDRGAMFLEWDGEPEYVNWEDGPKYMSMSLSQLLEDYDRYLMPNSHYKLEIDVSLTHEEIGFIRELFHNHYNIRELKLIAQRGTGGDEYETTDVKFETVDQIVLDELSLIQSSQYNKHILVSLYNNLDSY